MWGRVWSFYSALHPCYVHGPHPVRPTWALSSRRRTAGPLPLGQLGSKSFLSVQYNLVGRRPERTPVRILNALAQEDTAVGIHCLWDFHRLGVRSRRAALPPRKSYGV